MKRNKFMKFFSSMLAFLMVLSLLTPFSASANTQQPFEPSGESDLQVQAAITEQLGVLGGEPSLHEDLQGLSGNEQVAVIVLLSEKPVALERGIKELKGQRLTSSEATSVEKKVNAQQVLVKKEMTAKKVSYTEGFSYDTVLNGFATSVKADDLEKLLEIEGVVLVEPDAIRQALDIPSKDDGEVKAAMSTSLPFLGIDGLWEKGIEGNSVKVGVLDTGIDYDHPEFEGVYKGGKNYITHGSTYARPRADDDPYETSPLDRKSTTPEFDSQGGSFYTSHGTHVAGTIAAQGKNAYGIKGIAPKVELYAYRVLGGYGSGATAGIIKAIDDSVKDGMQVINLSLGGSSNSATASDAIAINNAMLGGTVAVIATGNSGPNRGTIGNPSTAALGIAVGNSTNPEEMHKASVSVTVGSYRNTSTMNLMGVKFGGNLATALYGEFDIVAVPGVGNPKDFVGIDVKDKVALISRGDIAFVDKIANAKAAGAKIVLIHNSAAGTGTPGPANVFLGDSFEFIPTFDMSYTEGIALRNALATAAGKVSFSDLASSFTPGDEMNDSSSRGPANPNFDVKPDVVAPGTNIMSSVAAYGKDYPDADYSESYDRYTGTSMATPHIAAIAALIRQANPTWTPFDVKVALSNTAKVLDKKFDVFAQGPGRVQPFEAAYPTILAYALDKTTFSGKEVDNEKGSVTFGRLGQVRDGAVTVKKQIRVEDFAKKGGDYTVRIETTKGFGDAKVTVDKSAFTLNGTEMLELTLSISKTTTIKAGDEILGYVYISGNGTEVSLPFAADFSPLVLPTGVHYVELSDHDVSFNGDGVKDSTSMKFQLVGRYGFNYIGLHDLLSDNIDEDMGFISYTASRNAGTYSLPITGTYTNWDNQAAGLVAIPEGVYVTAFYAQLATGAKAWYGEFDLEPLFVKNSAATVVTAESHETVGSMYTFNGTIVDKYIDFQEPLNEIGFGFDVNEKLFVTYELLNAAGDKVGEGPVNFAQDGAFSLDLTKLTPGDNTITISVDDAAGNKATYDYKLVAEEEPDVISLAVDTEKLALQVGDQATLTVTETTTKPDGSASDKDVTADATYDDFDVKVVTVSSEGKVVAVGVGTTEITVSYEGETALVSVKVEKKDVYVPPYTPPTNPTPTEPKPVDPKPITPPVFSDITNVFAKNEINKLAAKGIIQGKTETNFAPNAQITRAEFAVLLSRALDLPMKEYEGIFSDVNTSKKWAYAAVEAAARAGIVNGTANGKFNPDAPIKREEIAAMVVRAIEYQDKTKLTNLDTPANFKDHGSIGTFAIDSVYKATALGVILGNNGQFNPKNNATRAEAAVMLYRALDKLELLK
ncbi:S8 family serine peptidase [Sporosarcina sp. BP05]|uniref:S8 family serine peptidase n=1 Tax=Sporosarcina sp. BP05 TaxID=2758726 RepID=UPI001646F899|nr:S8 family serine peptidase [Sporosarcina sp. BP05]